MWALSIDVIIKDQDSKLLRIICILHVYCACYVTNIVSNFAVYVLLELFGNALDSKS